MSRPEPPRYSPGKFRGQPIDATRCRASVWDGFTHSQCAHRAKYGDWCGVHDPDRAAARAAKRGPTRFEREHAARKARERSRKAELDGLRAQLAAAQRALVDLDNTLEEWHRDEGWCPNYVEPTRDRHMPAIRAAREAQP